MGKSIKLKVRVGDLVQVEVWDHIHHYESDRINHIDPLLAAVVGWVTRISDEPVPCINIGNFIDSEATQFDEYCLLSSAIKSIKTIGRGGSNGLAKREVRR